MIARAGEPSQMQNGYPEIQVFGNAIRRATGGNPLLDRSIEIEESSRCTPSARMLPSVRRGRGWLGFRVVTVQDYGRPTYLKSQTWMS